MIVPTVSVTTIQLWFSRLPALECKIYLARIFKRLRPVQDKSCTPVLA